MSNEVRLFETIGRMINKFLPEMLEANRVSLAYLITGILGSQGVQLRQVASKVVYTGKETSLVERFRRFLQNENIVVKSEFSPFLKLVLSGLNQSHLVLAIDSTKVGGGCLCLMVSVVYKSRALPICWVVFKGRKGHSSTDLQFALLKTLKSLLPAEQAVILLGEGEFDGSELVTWFEQDTCWRYVCRTAHRLIEPENEWRAFNEIELAPKEEIFLTNVLFTQSQQVGPLMASARWSMWSSPPTRLVSN